jgi:hypothetical protein
MRALLKKCIDELICWLNYITTNNHTISPILSVQKELFVLGCFINHF